MSAALSLWARDLLAYSVQLGAVVATGLVLSALLRMHAPRVKLAFAQGLFALALALPWVQPWTAPTDDRAGLAVAFLAPETAARAALDPWPVLGALLVLGAVVRLAVLFRRLWRLRRCLRLSRGIEPSPVMADACARVGMHARVCWSDEIDVPAASGVIRPVVLVPRRFAGLGDAAQRAVLCHELVHVRRLDWLQMLVEELAAAVLWFHPAVWWLLSRIRLAREQVVDQEAVRLTRERRVYLETLVGLARNATSPPAPAPLFLTESHLERRVDVLLKEVTMSKARVVTVLAASVAGVALAGVAAVRAFPLEAPATAWQQPPDAGVQGGVPVGVEGGVPGGVAGGVAGGIAGGVAGGLADSRRVAGAEAKKAPERKLVQKVDPAYPVEAKVKAIEGLVQIDVLITAAGDVKDVKVTKGPSQFHESARSAVSQWKYEAGPHDTRATLTINYRLSKKDEKPRP